MNFVMLCSCPRYAYQSEVEECQVNFKKDLNIRVDLVMINDKINR